MNLRDRINTVINHPTVRPTAEQGVHVLDCAEVLAKGAIAYEDGGKSLLFEPIGPREWRAHVFCVAGQRGRAALDYGARCIAAMFADHGARRLEARAPRILPAVSAYARRLGFRQVGATPQEIIFCKEPC